MNRPDPVHQSLDRFTARFACMIGLLAFACMPARWATSVIWELLL